MEVAFTNKVQLHRVEKAFSRFWRILWPKSRGTFKEQTRIPVKLTIEKYWCRQKNHTWAFLEDFSPCRYEVDETRYIPTGNSKSNPFVFKSVLESNCERIHNTAIRGNFNPEPVQHQDKPSTVFCCFHSEWRNKVPAETLLSAFTAVCSVFLREIELSNS